jgi:DNA polymerase
MNALSSVAIVRRYLYLDIETRSPVNLRKAGVYRYAENKWTQIILLSWAIDDGPLQTWYVCRGDPCPPDLREAILDPTTLLIAHNASFERVVLSVVGGRCMPADIVKQFRIIARWDCTAARSCCLGLPRALEKVAEALHLSVAKDMDGWRLMMRMCVPMGIAEDGSPVWLEDWTSVHRLGVYCEQDVEVERQVDLKIPRLRPRERRLWELTERMNDRGIQVDERLLVRTTKIVQAAERDVNRRIVVATNGKVPKVSNHQALKEWLADQGYDQLPGVGKPVISQMLEAEELPDLIREVLIMRQEGSKSSAAKYKAIATRINADNRVRGALIYCGAAATKRFSSIGVQLQNLPRGGKVKDRNAHNQPKDYDHIGAAIDLIYQQPDLPEIEIRFGPALVVASEILRPVFIAPIDCWLARGDYSQIESRSLCYIAGQTDVIEAYRRYDAGTGPDLYITTAAQIYGVSAKSIDKDDPRRQVGKVTILACIASDELVLTDHGLVPIQFVTTEMLLWDGIEWVSHGGVIFKGYRDVIEYEGLTATEDHLVWVEGEEEPWEFGTAASQLRRLIRTGCDRHPVRIVESAGQPVRSERSETSYPLPVYQMRARTSEVLDPSDSQLHAGVPLHYKQAEPELSGQDETIPGSSRGTRSLYGPQKSFVEELRRPGHHVRLSQREGCCGLYDRDLRRHTDGSFDRSDRQHEGLCSGESSVCQHDYATRESSQNGAGAVQSSSLAVYASDRGSPSKEGNDSRGHDCRCGNIRGRETQTVVGRKTATRVYDIVDAGPRHRFTVSGRLVHNCGYQGGISAFQAFAKIYNLRISDEEAEKTKNAWRAANPHIVQLWWDLDNAAKACMRGEIGVKHIVRPGIWFVRTGTVLTLRMPSGNSLFFWYPQLEVVLTPIGEREVVSFWSMDVQKGLWKKFYGYGGLYCAMLTQSFARDIMANALINLEDADLPPVLTVHDEAVCQIPKTRFRIAEDAAHAVADVMMQLPDYAKTMPIAVDASANMRYMKV